jgi:hypothetical protein
VDSSFYTFAIYYHMLAPHIYLSRYICWSIPFSCYLAFDILAFIYSHMSLFLFVCLKGLCISRRGSVVPIHDGIKFECSGIRTRDPDLSSASSISRRPGALAFELHPNHFEVAKLSGLYTSTPWPTKLMLLCSESAQEKPNQMERMNRWRI